MQCDCCNPGCADCYPKRNHALRFGECTASKPDPGAKLGHVWIGGPDGHCKHCHKFVGDYTSRYEDTYVEPETAQQQKTARAKVQKVIPNVIEIREPKLKPDEQAKFAKEFDVKFEQWQKDQTERGADHDKTGH